jgi:hypothetical protein
MGGGCFRATGASEPGASSRPLLNGGTKPVLPPSPELGARLAPVLKAAGTSGSSSSSKLQDVLASLANSAPPEEIGDWFQAWLASSGSPTKARSGLLATLRQAAAHALDAKTAAVEKALSTPGKNSHFETVASLVEEHLRLEPELRKSLTTIAVTVSRASMVAPGLEADAAAYVVPAFDRVVLLFRRAILEAAAGGSAAGRLQRWRELEVETGLPILEEHLAVLSCGAKTLLLSLLLVPEGARPAQVVTGRDGCVLLDAAPQLPDTRGCVLLPYFESSSGTKHIGGRRVEGGEGHGPRKEFFVAACADATRAIGSGQLPPLFSFHRGSGSYWFSAYANDLEGPQAKDQRNRLRCFGKLLALAVVNHCKLSIGLPLLFFQLLLRPEGAENRSGEVPGLEDIESLDKALANQLKKCLKMKPKDFKELKEVSGLAQGMSREDYVVEQINEFMCPEAMREVRSGFWRLSGRTTWAGVAASDLRQMLCPAAATGGEIDIRKTFEVVIEEEMESCPPFVKAFWAVVDGLNADEKKRFLFFVTGVEACPEPKAEQLLIQLPFSAFSKEEHTAMLDRLPQAHTCNNCLELPSYHESLRETGAVTEDQGSEVLERLLKKLLGEKLRLAINETIGYELDAVERDGERDENAGLTSGSGAWHPDRPGTRPGTGGDSIIMVYESPDQNRSHVSAFASSTEKPATPGAGRPVWGAPSGPSPSAAMGTAGGPPPRQTAASTGASGEEELESLLESLATPRQDDGGDYGKVRKGAGIDHLLKELDEVLSDA